VKPKEKPLPGFEPLFSEIASKIRRKRKRGRGRPPKYSSPTHRAYLKERSAYLLGAFLDKRTSGDGNYTVRQQQNHVCAERAWKILQKSASAGFLIRYFSQRNSLLAELGRIESKDWLIRAAEEIAFNGLRGEQARALIRKIRFGGSSPRSRWRSHSILSGKIWKAVCQYRNLYPDITDEQILADLKKLVDWMPDSLKWDARERERRKAASVPPKA
jgi:hypothetical protein